MPIPKPHCGRTLLRLQQLEAREVPATMVSPSSITYQDADGDSVTVRLSHPVLTMANVNTVFEFDQGTVDGVNTQKQQLRLINLAAAPATTKPIGVTVTAIRSVPNGGDGFAAVGYVNGIGRDLGRVGIDGDLGQVDAGDTDEVTTGLASLLAQSVGRYGLTTQGGVPNLVSSITGPLGAWTIRGDMVGTNLKVSANDAANGRAGSITLGGSLIGKTAQTARIDASGAVKSISIGGNVEGSTGDNSGFIEPLGGVGSIRIGGSVLGGDGYGSGVIQSKSAMGTIRIAGDLVGGSSTYTGIIWNYTLGDSVKPMGSVQVGGSIRSGTGTNSGVVYADHGLGSLTVGGGLIGTAAQPVRIWAYQLASPPPTANLVIRSINIKGRVEFADIRAGHADGYSLNADAQIGTVTVGGDWIASSLTAGALTGNDGLYGTADDTVAGAGTNDPGRFSRIDSVSIGGQMLGTDAGIDTFGIVAQEVKKLRVGGTLVPTAVGKSNDDFFMGITGDLKVREI